MNQKLVICTFGLAAALHLAGCSAPGSPLRTALVDITGEARTIEVYPPGASPWPIAIHKQALSIGGLLNMPDIGQEYEFPGRRDVTTAVGIAVTQSYRLVGESDVPSDWDLVTRVRGALEATQALAFDASLITAEIAQVRSQLGDEQDERVQASIDVLLAERKTREEELRTADG